MTDMTRTMKLSHLSSPSSDVTATAAFFEAYLGCTASEAAPHIRILKRPGFDIVVEDASETLVQWPTNFHMGFELPTVDAVRALCERFRADGVEIETDVFRHSRGSRFFCRAPGGILIEINTRADADEAYRGTFDH